MKTVFQIMSQTLSESLQTALSSLDGVLKSVHERDSLMHFASEEEVSFQAVVDNNIFNLSSE